MSEPTHLDPGFVEATLDDPAIDPEIDLDHKELEEIGAVLDDPEAITTLAGGMDDPDGLDGPPDEARARTADAGGWTLDADLVEPEFGIIVENP